MAARSLQQSGSSGPVRDLSDGRSASLDPHPSVSVLTNLPTEGISAFGTTAAPPYHIVTASPQADSDIVVPADVPLAGATYLREGTDLVIETITGRGLIVREYFNTPDAADLATDTGGLVYGDWVSRLTQQASDGQVAQASPTASDRLPDQPIGQVETAIGNVTVTRTDGSTVSLSQGDPVFRDDLITTGPASTVGIVFADDSTFSLSDSGRMILDSFVYDPATEEGSAGLDVVEGLFSFASGAIAKAGPDAMVINTPVATIGIRGTTGVGEAAPEGQDNRIGLVQDADGGLGEIVVVNEAGTSTLNEVNTVKTLSGRFDPGVTQQVPFESIQQDFGSNLNALPDPATVTYGFSRTVSDPADDTDNSPPPEEATGESEEADLQEPPPVSEPTGDEDVIPTFTPYAEPLNPTIPPSQMPGGLAAVTNDGGALSPIGQATPLEPLPRTNPEPPEPTRGSDPDPIPVPRRGSVTDESTEPDTVTMTLGDDDVVGGAGNTTFLFDNAFGGTDTIDDKGGFDTVALSNLSGVAILLADKDSEVEGFAFLSGSGTGVLSAMSLPSQMASADNTIVIEGDIIERLVAASGNAATDPFALITENVFENGRYAYILAGNGTTNTFQLDDPNGSGYGVFGLAGDDIIAVTRGGGIHLDGGDGSDFINYQGLGGGWRLQASLQAGLDGYTIARRLFDANNTLQQEINDTVYNTENFRGSAGDDVITVSGNHTVRQLALGGGNDTATITSGTVESLFGGNGNDTFLVRNGATVGTLDGGSGNDLFRIASNASISNTIIGGDGADIFDIRSGFSGTGINGGGGADTVFLESGTTLGTIDLGAGTNDRLFLKSPDSTSVTQITNVERVYYFDDNASSGTVSGSTGPLNAISGGDIVNTLISIVANGGTDSFDLANKRFEVLYSTTDLDDNKDTIDNFNPLADTLVFDSQLSNRGTGIALTSGILSGNEGIVVDLGGGASIIDESTISSNFSDTIFNAGDSAVLISKGLTETSVWHWKDNDGDGVVDSGTGELENLASVSGALTGLSTSDFEMRDLDAELVDPPTGTV